MTTKEKKELELLKKQVAEIIEDNYVGIESVIMDLENPNEITYPEMLLIKERATEARLFKKIQTYLNKL